MEDKYIVAIEIGSSKIKGAVGTIDSSGTLTVKAVEEEKISDIVRYGCILNVVETASAIRDVISRLEKRVAPRRVEAVYLSAGGRSLRADRVQIERRLPVESEITRDLIADITDEALASPLHDRQVIGATIRDLRIDGTPSPRPIGQLGSHILASMNLISCRTQLLRNLSHVVEDRLHLKAKRIFLRPLAVADLVLVPNEMRLGCVLVDFGAETTTVSVYKEGSLRHLAVLPLGSRNITRDITHLNYLEERAEELKIQGGSALTSTDHASATRAYSSPEFTVINNYVAARAGEIIANINEQIKQSGLTPDKLPGGIIIVGRGARLNGFNQRLAQMTGMPFRVGTPSQRIRITDSSIEPADAVDILAILNMAAKDQPVECMSIPEPERPAEPAQSAGLYGVDSIYAQQTHRMPGAPAAAPAPAAATAPAAAPVRPTPAPTPAPTPTPVPTQTPVQQPAPAATTTTTAPTQPVVEPQAEKQPEKPGFMKRMLSDMRDRVINLMSDSLYEDEDE